MLVSGMTQSGLMWHLPGHIESYLGSGLVSGNPIGCTARPDYRLILILSGWYVVPYCVSNLTLSVSLKQRGFRVRTQL
jgi:hypothetical protein